MPNAASRLRDTPRNGQRPRKRTNRKLLTSTVATRMRKRSVIALPASQSRKHGGWAYMKRPGQRLKPAAIVVLWLRRVALAELRCALLDSHPGFGSVIRRKQEDVLSAGPGRQYHSF